MTYQKRKIIEAISVVTLGFSTFVLLVSTILPPFPVALAKPVTKTIQKETKKAKVIEKPAAKAQWVWNGQPEYKNQRLTEYAQMLKERGITDQGVIRLFLAQITQEAGSLSELTIGDSGCSLGIPQYNACVHKKMSAKTFLKKNPEWGDYKFQLNWMADNMVAKYQKFKKARCAIVAHNRPASARKCTNSTDTAAGYFATISRRAASLTYTNL